MLDAVGPARLVSRHEARQRQSAAARRDRAPGLAVGLGGVGVTLRDLVSIYAAIARGGTPVHLQRRRRRTPPADAAIAAPVLDPVAAWYVTDILADVPPPLNGSPGRIAYKTGTSYGYRDAWAIGFDGKTVIGVWVGRPDGAPVPGIAGITAAAPILFEAFDRLGTPAAPFRAAPPGVLFAANTELPAPLQALPPSRRATWWPRDAAPEIAFPADGVDVDLGLAAGDAGAADRSRSATACRPSPSSPTARRSASPPSPARRAGQPDGPAYVTLSVVDAEGRSDSVKVRVN